jgi:protease I
MTANEAYRAPLNWNSFNADDFDAFHFPGGHAPGMKPYLESNTVQQVARHAFAAAKPVSAICHGVIPLARAGVLKGRRTTALTAFQERVAIAVTRGRLGDHYQTYPVTVEAEVRAAVGKSGAFATGPVLPRYATMDRPDIGFVVRDGNYLSARWPGDAWTLATALVALLSPAKP